MKGEKGLYIPHLQSGGIITNYYCTSTCAHCLYRCSPYWPKDYISESRALQLFDRCKALGCRAVHIGGGEPFLNFPGLLHVLSAAKGSGVSIDYIETNSSWFKSLDDATEKLEKIRQLGVGTLLVSASPFHLEYIPFKKVKGVVEACRKVGLQPFLWTETFYRLFEVLDPSERYSLRALESALHTRISELVRSYWIHPGGRALETFFSEGVSAEELVEESTGGCRELSDTSHFHLDLYGNYVPGLCAGLAIRQEDLGEPLELDKYPVINILYYKGIKGLWDYAKERGFQPERKSYGSKCLLCYEIRKFLLKKMPNLLELAPVWHYQQE